MLLFRVFSLLSVKSIQASARCALTLSGCGLLCGFTAEACVKAGGIQVRIPRGHCLFFSASKPVELMYEQEDALHWITLKINHKELGDALFGTVRSFPCGQAFLDLTAQSARQHPGSLAALEQEIDLLLSDFIHREPSVFPVLSGIVSDFSAPASDLSTLCHLRLHPASTPPCDIEFASQKLQKLYAQLLQFVEDNIQSEISASQLACASGYSLRKLNAFLKQYSNCTASEFISRQRLDRAKLLLADPGLTITEVSALVGFRSVHYFSRLFKKRFGLSPQKFRSSAHTDL